VLEALTRFLVDDVLVVGIAAAILGLIGLVVALCWMGWCALIRRAVPSRNPEVVTLTVIRGIMVAFLLFVVFVLIVILVKR